MESVDRVINADYECWEHFLFGLDNGTEQLEGIVLHYSTYERADAVSAAKTLARALGFPLTETLLIGKKSVNTAWVVKDETETVQFMQLDIVQSVGVWTVYIHTSRLHDPYAGRKGR